MKILFCGGGTMGPVTPLIAVLRRMKVLNKDLKFIWAGTPSGPERQVVEKEGVDFFEIPVAKFPRYLSTNWIVWPFNFLKARSAAKKLINKEQPDLVVSAGGYTGVPVMRIAHGKNIPCAIHQLDALPGLSNKAVARWCKLVTTSFDYDKSPFFGVQTERLLTPCRFAGVTVPSKEQATGFFGLDASRSIVFIVGGGTGASALNKAVWSILDELLKKTQVIHMTGKGKGKFIKRTGYVQKEFLEEDKILNAYTAADLVVSRAGMGGISDLAALSKPAIFVPIPGGHQEQNLEKLLVDAVGQGNGFAGRLLTTIKDKLDDEKCLEKCGKRLHDELPTDDGTALAERWMGLLLK